MRDNARKRSLRVEKSDIVITNILSPQCAATLERSLKSSPHVIEVDISFATGRTSITYDTQGISLEDLVKKIESAGRECGEHEHKVIGPSATVSRGGAYLKRIGGKRGDPGASALRSESGLTDEYTSHMQARITGARNALIVALVLTAGMIATSPVSKATMIASLRVPLEPNLLHLILVTPAILYGGAFFFASGWRSLQRRTTYDAILISIAILAAYFYSIGATFLFKGTSLYITVGTVLSLVLFGHWLEMRIRLRATGTPQFTTRARKSRTDTALAGVARIIEEARQSRANVQYAIDAIVPYIPPLAIIAGIIAFFFWGLIAQKGSLFALLAGMATIIIARPDTLALAATTAVMVGIGVGSRRGILIKSATAMERATRLDVILFDRVGVLTEGKLAVSDIVHVGKLTELGFLRLAAGLEKVAEHTYSRAIVEVAEGKVGMGLPAPSEFRVMPGYGTVGRVETRSIIVGNKRLMIDSEIDIRPVEEKASTLANQGKMVIYVAVGDRIEGILGIADSVRPGSKEAVRKLRKAGVSVALLTEEDTDTANAAAHELGIDKVYAEVLPAGKAERIKYLQRKGKCVGMVGDGEHDAIALTQADLGIAIGVGQNAPAKSGEIVLNSSDPLDVVDAIMLSRQVTRKIRQNIIWGVTYNSVAVILAMGILYPPLGIMVRPEIAAIVAPASMIATTLNSSFLKYRTNRSRI